MDLTNVDNNNKVARLSIKIDEHNIETDVLKVLAVVRSNWSKDDIEFKLLTDGITNKLIGCKLKGLPDEETVLVRIYGNKTDLLIDRKAETRNIILLNKFGLAPQLYATFGNGLAYAFMLGCTLTSETVTNPKIYHLVAQKMAQLHKVTGSDAIVSKQPMLWTKLQSFLDLVPDKFSDPVKRKKFEETIMPKERIQKEIDFMRAKLSATENPIVFAHNDLLLGNVIYTAPKNAITFIDYEYACFNYQAYDIGNHFTEFVGVSNMDLSKYPSKELQFDWLRTYLAAYNGSETVIDEDIERLYVLVNQFALVAYLFWGVWGLIQTEHSYIDFDFLEFAAIKFNEYRNKKDEFLSLKFTR